MNSKRKSIDSTNSKKNGIKKVFKNEEEPSAIDTDNDSDLNDSGGEEKKDIQYNMPKPGPHAKVTYLILRKLNFT
jgi:hypothetical protein